MKAWVFQYVGAGLTSNWHSGGGVVVIADTPETAKEMLKQQVYDAKEAWDDIDFAKPDALYELVGDPEPTAWIFPDAGCC